MPTGARSVGAGVAESVVEDDEDESSYKVQRAAQSQPPEERFNTVARLDFALATEEGRERGERGNSIFSW